MSTQTPTPETPETDLELEISGMTCASCAARVEKNLNKLDGVDASVNFATEKARVRAPEGVDPDLLIDAVAQTGYTATLPESEHDHEHGQGHEHDHGGLAGPEDDRQLESLRVRLIASVLLAVPVIAMSSLYAYRQVLCK